MEEIIKRTIGGREYSFAPLLLKELRAISRLQGKVPVGFEAIDFMVPLIRSSMKRAEGPESAIPNEMPDLEEMTLSAADLLATEFYRAVAEASGVKIADRGEALPARTNGETSIASSSPLPDGVLTISTASPSTT